MTLLRVLPAIAAVALLAGCNPFAREYVSLNRDELLEPCTTMSEIAVETLAKLVLECEPVGSTLVFPDGETLALGSGGGSKSQFVGDSEPVKSYGYQTLGIYGVVASAWVDDCAEFQS